MNLLPPLSDEEYALLRDDIEAHGVLDPIERCAITGELLDGHHRLKAAAEVGVECPERLIDGLETPAQRSAYALRRNINRRQLTKAQLDELSEDRKQVYFELRDEGGTQAGAATAVGVTQSTGQRWEKASSSTRAGNATDQRRRLTDDDEAAIVASLAKGATQESQAEAFDVAQKTVSNLWHRRGPDFVPLPWTVQGVEVRLGDARDHWPDDLADLAVFSPPYNVGVDYDGDEDEDHLPEDEWWDLVATTMAVLRDGWQVSRIVVNVPAARGRVPYLPVELPEIDGLDLEAVIVWDKGTTGNRTTWGSWRQPGAPYLRDRTERLYVYRTAHQLRGAEDSYVGEGTQRVSPLITSSEFTRWTQDLWSIPPASAEALGHPAPFPWQLPEAVIKLYGWAGCRVIDPFGGSGSTGEAAIRCGCEAVLVDRSETYCRAALRRLWQ